MNVMSYKGYQARIEYDDEDSILVGRIAGIQDIVSFHADDVAGLRAAFHEAVDDYVETCEKVGKEPQKSFSGKMMFRVSPQVHRSAAIAAELAGVSLNQWAEDALREAARESAHDFMIAVSEANAAQSSAQYHIATSKPAHFEFAKMPEFGVVGLNALGVKQGPQFYGGGGGVLITGGAISPTEGTFKMSDYGVTGETVKRQKKEKVKD